GDQGAPAYGRLPARGTRAPAHALFRSATPFRLRRLDRDRHEAVAADRRRRRGGPQVSALMSTTRGDAGRLPPRGVDGVLLLDKPAGLTSNAALQCAKRLYRAEKAGHTGTLDPLASGLLPLCLGDATKFAQSLLDARKEYVATVRFGIATSTGDSEGAVIAESAAMLTPATLQSALPRFVGRIRQIPPSYAALKHEGRAYYSYARAGVEIPRAPREVDIGAIELLAFAWPTATLRVECGKGTYIRVLAEDMAAAVGSCAHLVALRRTASGAFRLE